MKTINHAIHVALTLGMISQPAYASPSAPASTKDEPTPPVEPTEPTEPEPAEPIEPEPAEPTEPAPAEPSTPPAPSPPPPRVVAAPIDVATPAPTDPCRRDGHDRCRRIEIGGGITTALGIAAAGIGIGLAATRNREIEGRPAYEKNYRSAGVMALSVGVILVVAGALVLREGRRLERRSTAWSRTMARRVP